MSNEPPQNGAGEASAAELIATIQAASKKGPPPVHLWNPPFSGNMDMRIARDGSWFHEGGRIERPGLVRLFASILKREGDDYFLVTPVEKVGIVVDDAPFVAVDFESEEGPDGPVLIFETNVGDTVRAGPDHAITVTQDDATGEPSPYIHVRRNLHALIDRKSFYRLAERAEETDDGNGARMVVRSGGESYVIGDAS